MQAEVVNRRLVKFIWAAAIFFAWTLIQGVVQTQEPVRLFIAEQGSAGMLGSIHVHIGLMGWMSLALIGSLLLCLAHFQWQVRCLAKAY